MELREQIAQRVMALLKAETVVVAESESNGEMLHYVAAVGKHAPVIVGKRGLTATSGLCGAAMNGHCPVLSAKTAGDSRVRQDYVESLGIYTALAVPLEYQGEVLGAIMALNRTDGSSFDEEAEQILADYATEVSPLLL